MTRFALLFLGLFLSCSAPAWEEQVVLDYIVLNNPMLSAYRYAINTYSPPTAMQKVLEHTSVYGQLGAGGTEFRSDSVVVAGGVRLTIPLSSKKEDREWAQKGVEQARVLDEIRSRVFEDISTLRTHEADLAAASEKFTFYKDKSTWQQDRVDQGYDEQQALWEIGQVLTETTADVNRLTILRNATRKRVAWHAGAQWAPLLAYLKGETTTLDME
jgi:hypothetical protein